MRDELTALRSLMSEQGIDAYIVPTTDYHGSEYVHDYFKCRKFLSGFTGSAGTLLVEMDKAELWTDGRYFLQATKQLEDSGIDLMKMGDPGVPTLWGYIQNHFNENSCIGFDGRVIDIDFGKQLEDFCHIKYDLDLTDPIWKDRPAIHPTEIYPIPMDVTGESSESKLARIREEMKLHNADFHIVTSLPDIAWIYNLRADDVENTPVFYAYTIITMNDARLYVMDKKLKDVETAKVLPYDQFMDDVKKLGEGTLMINAASVNFSILKAVPECVKVINEKDPSELMKAIKNPAEIKSTLNAHLKDGIAMVNFSYWLKKNVGKIPMTELSISDKILEFRKEQEGFNDISFTTIAGYGQNGAIIHYAPTPESNTEVRPDGFLLLDSGGQYNDGTTDITRTYALGPVTEEMKLYYTAVLKSHITLATALFTPDTLCRDLDRLTRGPVNVLGYDYNHGTGHGVGHMLSVHEGPQSISKRASDQTMYPGMITSDEPGVYLENKFGIRIESEILCVEKEPGVYGFETITLCPHDLTAVNKEQLTEKEIEWINTYHARVYRELSPYLNSDVKAWLREVTLPI